MRSCEQHTQRFNRDTDALKKQITDLTESTSGGRQLSEAAHRLNPVNNDVRLLKLAIGQTDQTIDQLRTNAQALARRQTPGTSGVSPQVDSGDLQTLVTFQQCLLNYQFGLLRDLFGAQSAILLSVLETFPTFPRVMLVCGQ